MAEPATVTSNYHELQFNNYLVEFIQKMKVILPEQKRNFAKYYKYYRGFVDKGKRVEFIAEFVQYISKYKKELSICDEGLFSEEEDYYPNKPIQLMKGLDFKKIWRDPSLSEISKENIWKYLHTLYLVGTFVLKEHEKYTELLKRQNKIINKLYESMMYEKKIKTDAEKMNQEETGGSGGADGFDFSGLSDLLDGDNIITQLAMEVAKEMTDAGDVIQLLFNKDSNKMEEIAAKVSQKLASVLQDKGLTEEDLITQAKDMNEKICGKMKNIPGLEKIVPIFKQYEEQLKSQKVTSVNELMDQLKQDLSQFMGPGPEGPEGPEGPAEVEKTN